MKNNYGKIRINEAGDKTIKVKKSDLAAIENDSSSLQQQKKGESTSYGGGIVGTLITNWLVGKGMDMIKAKQAASAAQTALQQGATTTEAATQAAQTAGLSSQATTQLTTQVVSAERAAAEQAFSRLTGQAATQAATETATGAAAEATKQGAIRQALQQAAKTPLKDLATQRGLWLKGFFIRDPAIVAQMAEGNPGLARMTVQTLGRPITGLLTKSAGAVGIDAATLGTGVGEVAAGTVGLAILVGAIVGTSIGWITNKTMSWFGTGFKEQAKDTIEKAIRDKSFLMQELNDYQKLGGYKYEAGDEDDKESNYDLGFIPSIGYSTKGERIKKFGIPGFRDYERTPNSYDTKDGIIIINLLSILYDNDKREGKITKSKEMVEGEEFELDDISSSNIMKYQKLINLFGSVEGGFKPRLLTKKFEDDQKLMSLIKSLLISCAVANIPASKQVATATKAESKFKKGDTVMIKGSGDKKFVVVKVKDNEIIVTDSEQNAYAVTEEELISSSLKESKQKNIKKQILKEINFLLKESTDLKFIAKHILASEIQTYRFNANDGGEPLVVSVLEATSWMDNVTEEEMSFYINNGANNTEVNSKICQQCKGIVMLDGEKQYADAIYYIPCKNNKPTQVLYVGATRSKFEIGQSIMAAYEKSTEHNNASTYLGYISSNSAKVGDKVKTSDGKIYVVVKIENLQSCLIADVQQRVYRADPTELVKA